MPPFTIRIPGLPPSDNNLYATGQGGGRHKSKKAKEWETEVVAAVLKQSSRADRVRFRDQLLAVTITFYFPLYTKAGVMHRWDVSSHQKLTLDKVCDLIERDDMHVTHLDLAKHDLDGDSKPFTRVAVYATTPAELT